MPVRVQSYQDLIVWQRAIVLVESIYRATHSWPREESYGLTSQVRRAAVSVPANIAEGQGRTALKEFLHHLSIANGSLYELETHLLIARRLNYSDEALCKEVMSQAAEVGRLLHGLIKSLQPA